MVVQTFYTLRKQKILISCNSALIQLIEALFYQIQKQNGVYLKIAIKPLQSGKTHKIFLLK
jgi:recombinational DNA repair protein (RecF pathway)